MHPTLEILSIRISVFSLLIIIAVSICFITYVSNKKYTRGYTKLIFRFFVITLAGASIGGRLLSALTLLQSSPESFFHNLIFGGFVFYGGVIGGLISLLLYCSITRIPFLDICDVFASLMPLGQAIGRIGCYMNGCCYGVGQETFFSVPYVVNGINTRVFPTWFIESGFCLLLAIYFQVIYRSSKSGMHTAIYFISYSLFRFINEFFRGDDVRGVYGWISTSQIISILFFLTGIYVFILSYKKDESNELLYSRQQPTVI